MNVIRMPTPCTQIRKEYEDIKALKKKFDLEYDKALKTGNLDKAKELKAKLEKKRDALKEKLWAFESLPQKELKKQYENQREILERVGILEKLSTGEMGIKGIDNKEYAFPKYQEITKRVRENKEILGTKTEQGFVKLLIVPFGMKLDDLIEKYKEVILKHHKEGKLLATKENPTDPDEQLELDESEPVWSWDEYKDADTEGKLVYFPEEFSENHKGKTKKEILSSGGGSALGEKEQGGWSVLLIENLPSIPRENKGEEIKSRKQLEAGKTPNEYLKILKEDPQYANETGMTPEDQIIYAINHLEKTNQVIDDYSGKGSASYQLGAYFTGGNVPDADWDRDDRQASVDGGDPGDSNSGDGVRGAVRVF